MNIKKYLKENYLILVSAFLGCMIAIVLTSIFKIIEVNGTSMDNTLKDGEKLILSTINYKNEEPQRGDIVVIDQPQLSIRYLVKRIIGVGGDIVEIKDNQLYINGTKIEEDYIPEAMKTDDLKMTLADDEVFIMGDNRNHSLDSRSPAIGAVNTKTIYGKVLNRD